MDYRRVCVDIWDRTRRAGIGLFSLIGVGACSRFWRLIPVVIGSGASAWSRVNLDRVMVAGRENGY